MCHKVFRNHKREKFIRKQGKRAASRCNKCLMFTFCDGISNVCDFIPFGFLHHTRCCRGRGWLADEGVLLVMGVAKFKIHVNKNDHK